MSNDSDMIKLSLDGRLVALEHLIGGPVVCRMLVQNGSIYILGLESANEEQLTSEPPRNVIAEPSFIAEVADAISKKRGHKERERGREDLL